MERRKGESREIVLLDRHGLNHILASSSSSDKDATPPPSSSSDNSGQSKQSDFQFKIELGRKNASSGGGGGGGRGEQSGGGGSPLDDPETRVRRSSDCPWHKCVVSSVQYVP